uniref:PDZ domain-containing protein n=1 Tax=Eptatretus burgeri TaxID=7764 RepID=A0A8C4QZZ4_EPTBU
MRGVQDVEAALHSVTRLQGRLAEHGLGTSAHADQLALLQTTLQNPAFLRMLALQGSIKQLGEQLKMVSQPPSPSFDFMPSGQLSWNGQPKEALQEPLLTVQNGSSNCSVESINLYKPNGEGLGFSVMSLQNSSEDKLGIIVKKINEGGIAHRDGRLQTGDQILSVNDVLVDSIASQQKALELLQQPDCLVRLLTTRGSLSNEMATASTTQLGVNAQEQRDVIELMNPGGSLGFGIVGNKESGITVKTILPGGVADKDGRLRIGDRILSIDESDIQGLNSSEVIGILRKCGTRVQLEVSRPHASDVRCIPAIPDLPASSSPMQAASPDSGEYDEMEIFGVELSKDELGFGINLSSSSDAGVFVKSIVPGSPAHKDGRIESNDRVVSVNGTRIGSMSRMDAIQTLRNTDQTVCLTLARPKKEDQQESQNLDTLDGLDHSMNTLTLVHEQSVDEEFDSVEEDADVSVSTLPFPKQPTTQTFMAFGVVAMTNTKDSGTWQHEDVALVSPENSTEVEIPVDDFEEQVGAEPFQSVAGAQYISGPKPAFWIASSADGDPDEDTDGLISQVEVRLDDLPHKVTPAEDPGELGRALATDTVLDSGSGPTAPIIQHKPAHPQIKLLDHEQNDLNHNSGAMLLERAGGGDEDGHSVPHVACHWGLQQQVSISRPLGTSLGISIVRGKGEQNSLPGGIYVKKVLEGSPAWKAGNLHTGDHIMTVNGESLRDMTQAEVAEILRESPNPIVFTVEPVFAASTGAAEEDDEDTDGMKDCDRSASSSRNGSTHKAGFATNSNQGSSMVVSRKQSQEYEMEGDIRFQADLMWQQFGELPGDLLQVDLEKKNGELGLSLAGNKNRSRLSIFVVGVTAGGPAAQNGCIRVGDELLEINGQMLYGKSHQNASAIIKCAPSSVKLVLLRKQDAIKHMAVSPITSPHALSLLPVSVHKESRNVPVPAAETAHFEQESKMPDVSNVRNVELPKENGSIGLALMGLGGREGVFVKGITSGGPADRDGQIKIGDRILALGDETVISVPASRVLELIESAERSVKLKVGYIERPNNQVVSLPQPQSSHLPTSPVPATAIPSPSVPPKPATCPVFPGRETMIEICKGRTGLGLSVVGGSDTPLGAIVIHEVYEEGAAAKDSRLWPGDQILKVNGLDLRGATHEEATIALRRSPPLVRLLVFRDVMQGEDPEPLTTFTVELQRKPCRGLGLSIACKKNAPGIFIAEVMRGGVADLDGRLMHGDQILAVDGEDLRTATQETVAAILKCAQGLVRLEIGRIKIGSPSSSQRTSRNSQASRTSANSIPPAFNSVVSTSDPRPSPASCSDGSVTERPSDLEVQSKLRTVELIKDENNSLGLSIAGGKGSPLGDIPVFVAMIQTDGPAAVTQQLKIGDQLLSINGQSVDDLTHAQVVNLLKTSSRRLRLQVTGGEECKRFFYNTDSVSCKNASAESTEDDAKALHYKTITLERGPEGLGFSIVGGHGSPHGDLPIYIKTVFNKGAAGQDGQLQRGDQIISVNGQSLEGMMHEEAVAILKSQGPVTLVILS